MNYSICLLDKTGRTQHSEFSPFDDDAAAERYAQTQIGAAAIVELWKANSLIVRFDQSVANPVAQ
jgi:hypothetical protein